MNVYIVAAAWLSGALGFAFLWARERRLRHRLEGERAMFDEVIADRTSLQVEVEKLKRANDRMKNTPEVLCALLARVIQPADVAVPLIWEVKRYVSGDPGPVVSEILAERNGAN